MIFSEIIFFLFYFLLSNKLKAVGNLLFTNTQYTMDYNGNT